MLAVREWVEHRFSGAVEWENHSALAAEVTKTLPQALKRAAMLCVSALLKACSTVAFIDICCATRAAKSGGQYTGLRR
jgi:hypothetical protein